jgi:hypothetical protein
MAALWMQSAMADVKHLNYQQGAACEGCTTTCQCPSGYVLLNPINNGTNPTSYIANSSCHGYTDFGGGPTCIGWSTPHCSMVCAKVCQ